MRILAVSRKYPPSIGGMQTYSRHLMKHLLRDFNLDQILLKRSQYNLIWFLPYAFVMSFLRLCTRKYDVIYIFDAFLAPLGVFLKRVFNIPVIVTVHGLDVAYNRFFYQKIIPGSVGKLDKVICVSNNTIEECVKRGIARSKCIFIPNGMDPEEHYMDLSFSEAVEKTEKLAGCDLKEKKILITVGRLVKRKGVAWFIENVFSQLNGEYVYLIIGEGPESGEIKDIIAKTGLEEKVRMLGYVDMKDLSVLYRAAYLFIMPNQKVVDDPEGFGIVAVEAAGCGLPTIANSIEGITDAVIENQTGHLVEYNNAELFIRKIRNAEFDREKVMASAMKFSWQNIIEKYNSEIKQTAEFG